MIFTNLQKVLSDDNNEAIKYLKECAVPYHAEIKEVRGADSQRCARLILDVTDLKKECTYFIEGDAFEKLKQGLGVSSVRDMVGREFTIYSKKLDGSQEHIFALEPEKLESICAIQIFNDFSTEAA